MTEQEKREEARIRIEKKGLRQKVRKHRPAAKVIELETMVIEDQIERLKSANQRAELGIRICKKSRSCGNRTLQNLIRKLNDIKQKIRRDEKTFLSR